MLHHSRPNILDIIPRQRHSIRAILRNNQPSLPQPLQRNRSLRRNLHAHGMHLRRINSSIQRLRRLLHHPLNALLPLRHPPPSHQRPQEHPARLVLDARRHRVHRQRHQLRVYHGIHRDLLLPILRAVRPRCYELVVADYWGIDFVRGWVLVLETRRLSRPEIGELG